jgi:hypothetical protein
MVFPFCSEFVSALRCKVFVWFVIHCAAGRQPLENGPARRVGTSTEHVIALPHRKTIAKWLWFVKRNVEQFLGSRTGAM